jgi:hypothetical protein
MTRRAGCSAVGAVVARTFDFAECANAQGLAEPVVPYRDLRIVHLTDKVLQVQHTRLLQRELIACSVNTVLNVPFC